MYSSIDSDEIFIQNSSTLTRNQAFDLAKKYQNSVHQRASWTRNVSVDKGTSLFATGNAEKTRILKNKSGAHITSKPKVDFSSIDHEKSRTFTDMFNELMSYSTLKLIVILYGVIIFMWLLFASFYYLSNMLIMHKIEEENPKYLEYLEITSINDTHWSVPIEKKILSPSYRSKNFNKFNIPYQRQCLTFEKNFTFINAFLFSLESQTTIGYGSRHPEDNIKYCWPILLIQCCQPILALAIQGIIIGIVFKKLKDARYSKIRYFLPNCCINKRDNRLCLIFRSNIDRNCPNLINVKISVKLLKNRNTLEGYKVILQEHDIKIANYSATSTLLATQIPVDLVHNIDRNSPLYELDAKLLKSFNNDSYTKKENEQIEIVINLSAKIESTQSIYQSSQSYVLDDILWGFRFKQCIFRSKSLVGDSRDFIVNEENIEKYEKVEIGKDSQEERDLRTMNMHK